MRWVRFGDGNRKHYACRECGTLVHHTWLKGHALFHAGRGDLDGPSNPSFYEGERRVLVVGNLAYEVV